MSRARVLSLPLTAVMLAAVLYPSTAVHATRMALARRARVPLMLVSTLMVAVLSLSSAAAVTAPQASMWVASLDQTTSSVVVGASPRVPTDVDRCLVALGGQPAAATEAQAAAAGTTVNVLVTVKGPAPPPPPPPPPPTLTPVYRFYSARSGTHFYTPSAVERDIVRSRWPDVWAYEGVVYSVNPAKNSQPLYRFWNPHNSSHFYTASVAERDLVLRKWSNVFTYEGEMYRVSPKPSPGATAVYRFYNKKNGSHFYTASAGERDIVIARWSATYTLEGEVFWLAQ